MNYDWQTPAALAVVLTTAGIFAYRLLTRKKTGCGGGCACPAPRKPGSQPER